MRLLDKFDTLKTVAGARMKRALLVEDHILFREVLTVVLEEETDLKGTVQAGSLAEARQVLGDLSGEIDLVIIDLDLPDGDGISLIENIREAETSISVLTLTTGRSMERRALALRVGASEVLSTSSSSEKIVGTVNRLVGA
jgi:two-component system OmpR family response regulator